MRILFGIILLVGTSFFGKSVQVSAWYYEFPGYDVYKALYFAIKSGNASEVDSISHRFILNMKEYLREEQFVKVTPLNWAIINGNSEIVEILIIKNDADASAPSCLHMKEKTPIITALLHVISLDLPGFTLDDETGELDESGKLDESEYEYVRNNIERLIGEFHVQITPLEIAVLLGNLQIIEILIKHGANVNYPDEADTVAPIILAAAEGYLEVCKILVANGSNVNDAHSRYKWTSLHAASLNGTKELAEYLIEQGANVNAKSYENWTPLHIAFYFGNEEVKKVLIDHGADLNAKNEHNETPIDLKSVYATYNYNSYIFPTHENWHKASIVAHFELLMYKGLVSELKANQKKLYN